MKRQYQETNFLYLLVALVFLLTAVPVANDFDMVSAPLARGLVFSLLLLIGVWSLRKGETYFKIGMIFVIAGVMFNVLAYNMQSQFLSYGSLIALIGFLLVAIIFTLVRITAGTEVNRNRLTGAVCVYLMLGVIWAMCYTVLELIAPGSFTGFSPNSSAGWDSEWLYFSFVTMTTLGYGDILPATAIGQTLAYMQAVFGQFYVAMLVAGLVGAYISDRQREKSDQP